LSDGSLSQAEIDILLGAAFPGVAEEEEEEKPKKRKKRKLSDQLKGDDYELD
jgi:flagellar motor switch protein FliM